MSSERVPDIIVEQYVLGELPAGEATRLEQIPGFKERAQAIRDDNEAFLRENPPEVFARRILNQYESEQVARPHQRRPRPLAGRLIAFGLPAAAALAFAVVFFGGVGPTISSGDGSTEITRLKGLEPTLQIYRSTGSQVDLLADGAIAHAGDVLQIAFNAGEARFAAIVSVDGNAVVTLHMPVSPTASSALAGGGTQQLQYAYQLDDAPDFERFYLITSDTEFSVAEIYAEIEAQAPAIVRNPERSLRLPRGLEVDSILVDKGD